MTLHNSLLLAILLVGSTTPVAVAQTDGRATVPPIDLSVEQVASGGWWESGKISGTYRVVIVREGSEEIRRRAFLQWIQQNGPRQPDSLKLSLELNTRAAAYALGEPSFRHEGSRWILRLKAASRPLGPFDESRDFDLGPPGTVVLARHP